MAHLMREGRVNEDGLFKFLTAANWPRGLQETVLKGLDRTPMRFFIIDDSGSMGAHDGERVMSDGNSFKFVKCSRWEELREAIKFHANLTEAACAPTEFRLLNGSAPIVLGLGGENDGINHTKLVGFLDRSPGGGTPLCRHINEIIPQIQAAKDQLLQNGQKAVVIIATDGESSDGDIARAMIPLQSLPVNVVIRLCTNDDKVCEYWNNIDKQLEVEIDILDDLQSEANDVFFKNPWLIYADPIHRLREFGIPNKEFDIVDEVKLSSEQLKNVIHFIYGGKKDDIPHPEVDKKNFQNYVAEKIKGEPMVWCPRRKTSKPYISMDKLISGDSCCVIS